MPEPSKPRVAVIGLGSMGFGMATSLKRAGFEVTGCDVSADAVARFVRDGGKGAKTPAEAALDRGWVRPRPTTTPSRTMRAPTGGLGLVRPRAARASRRAYRIQRA